MQRGGIASRPFWHLRAYDDSVLCLLAELGQGRLIVEHQHSVLAMFYHINRVKVCLKTGTLGYTNIWPIIAVFKMVLGVLYLGR